MEPIYKMYDGSHIDLDKIVSISSLQHKNDGFGTWGFYFTIEVQLRDKFLAYWFIDDDDHRCYFGFDRKAMKLIIKLEDGTSMFCEDYFNPYIERTAMASLEVVAKKELENLINVWKTYKKSKEIYKEKK